MLGARRKIVFSKIIGIRQQQDDASDRDIRIRLCTRSVGSASARTA